MYNALREYLHFCFETWPGQRGGGLNAIRVGKNLVALPLSRDESSMLDRAECTLYPHSNFWNPVRGERNVNPGIGKRGKEERKENISVRMIEILSKIPVERRKNFKTQRIVITCYNKKTSIHQPKESRKKKCDLSKISFLEIREKKNQRSNSKPFPKIIRRRKFVHGCATSKQRRLSGNWSFLSIIDRRETMKRVPRRNFSSRFRRESGGS